MNDEAVNDKVLIYRILFQLKTPEKIKFDFKCNNNLKNWLVIKDFIQNNESDYFSNIIKDSIINADLSVKNLSNIFSIISDKSHIILPNNFSKTCPLTGTLVVILKDFLEFLGILFERKVIAKKALETTNNCLLYHQKNKEILSNFLII